MSSGEARFSLTTVFVFAQVGDGTTTQRNAPVSVAGLSTGVAMITIGDHVRRVLECCVTDVCERAGLLWMCLFFLLGLGVFF